MSELRECIEKILRERNMNMSDLAGLLHYKSKTSIIRIMDDQVRTKTLQDFSEKIHTYLQLTYEETKTLENALQIKERGADAVHIHEAFSLLMHCNYYSTGKDDLLIYTNASMTHLQRLPERYADSRDIRIIFLNCPFVHLLTQLKELLQREDVEVSAFMQADAHLADIIKAIAFFMPLMLMVRFQPYYSNYVADPNHPMPLGVRYTDAMCISYTDPDGKRMEDFIVFHSQNVGICLATQPCGNLWEYFSHQLASFYRPIKNLFSSDPAPTSLVEFIRYCSSLERYRSYWRIKTDFCLDVVPPDILLGALKEDLPEETLTQLYTVCRDRYRANSSNNHHSYQIMRREGVEAFARTGRLSDHPSVLRPFTTQERLVILSTLLETVRTNIHRHYYLLKDYDAMNDLVMECYDKKGLLLLPRVTTYDINRSYNEVMVSHPPLTEAYKRYFLTELIPKACYPESETVKLLESMVGGLSV